MPLEYARKLREMKKTLNSFRGAGRHTGECNQYRLAVFRSKFRWKISAKIRIGRLPKWTTTVGDDNFVFSSLARFD